MSAGTGSYKTESSRRTRKRLRGMFESRTSKTIGLASIAAPLVGYVVRDLKKPDSVIRGLVSTAVKKLLATGSKKAEALDISDKVEIIEDGNNRNN